MLHDMEKGKLARGLEVKPSSNKDKWVLFVKSEGKQIHSAFLAMSVQKWVPLCSLGLTPRKVYTRVQSYSPSQSERKTTPPPRPDSQLFLGVSANTFLGRNGLILTFISPDMSTILCCSCYGQAWRQPKMLCTDNSGECNQRQRGIWGQPRLLHNPKQKYHAEKVKVNARVPKVVEAGQQGRKRTNSRLLPGCKSYRGIKPHINKSKQSHLKYFHWSENPTYWGVQWQGQDVDLSGWCSGSGVGLKPGRSRFKSLLDHKASWLTLDQLLSLCLSASLTLQDCCENKKRGGTLSSLEEGWYGREKNKRFTWQICLHKKKGLRRCQSTQSTKGVPPRQLSYLVTTAEISRILTMGRNWNAACSRSRE